MSMKKNVWTMLILAAFAQPSFANADLKNVNATKKLSTEVIHLVEEGNIESAFNQLKSYWPLQSNEIDLLLTETKEKRELVLDRFGKSLGVEFIRTERAGNNLVRHVFIERFERHALRWQLSFYKPGDHWMVNSVNWDDKLTELYS